MHTTSPSQRGIGNINSTAPGSAARYNAGKAPLQLIPLGIVSMFLHRQACRPAESTTTTATESYHSALRKLGRFQMRLSDGDLMKNTADNTRNTLYQIIEEVGATMEDAAQVFDYGRKKYAEWNWAKGMPWSEVIGSAARHLCCLIRGEIEDHESGLPHRGHVACNIVMLLHYHTHYPSGDDRPQRAVPVVEMVDSMTIAVTGGPGDAGSPGVKGNTREYVRWTKSSRP